MQLGNLLIPLCHQGKSSDGLLAEVLPGVLFVRGLQREFEDLLAVIIFSPCGGYRRLPSCQAYLARGQVPL